MMRKSQEIQVANLLSELMFITKHVHELTVNDV